MRQQKESPRIRTDWHRADIIAAIRKQGTTLAAVARENDLASNTLQNALRVSWPKGERIIARAIGIEPEDIWPSRYPHPNKSVKNNVSTNDSVSTQREVA
ncbi:helix-turn-helix domain-containing protein [Shewanella sp. 1180_01]|uniref:helix-turn-helix domain-containing protein n=1 Tax=Shewanella sp. 1180_01 TaxID=2604451 RepID=UPI0040637F2B